MANQSSSAGISIEYKGLLASVSALLEEGRRNAAKSVNAVLTATYWLVGKRIVEYEQGGQDRAAYGSEVLKRLSADLGGRFGRGFSRQCGVRSCHPPPPKAGSEAKLRGRRAEALLTSTQSLSQASPEQTSHA